MDSFKLPGKGDYAHKFWQHTVKEFYASQGYPAVIEKRFRLKNVDVGFEKEGKKTAIEIELRPDHLVENVHLDFEAGCDKVIIASQAKKPAKATGRNSRCSAKHCLRM